jgi:acetyl-CoA acetyltransferase
MPTTLKDEAVIAGIGQTEFSKNSGRSELLLACAAVKAALDDAGLTPGDVDGMTTFTMDTSDEIEVARAIGAGAAFSRIPLRRRRGVA